MKTAVINWNYSAARTAPRYPNAANHRQILQKIVDHLLVGAISIGCTAIVLFLAVLA